MKKVFYALVITIGLISAIIVPTMNLSANMASPEHEVKVLSHGMEH